VNFDAHFRLTKSSQPHKLEGLGLGFAVEFLQANARRRRLHVVAALSHLSIYGLLLRSFDARLVALLPLGNRTNLAHQVSAFTKLHFVQWHHIRRRIS